MQGKTVVATGATSGIGEVAVLALARMGARIVFVARDERRAVATLKKLETQAPRLRHGVHLADLSLMAEARRVGLTIAQQEPRIDVLINNAGAIYGSRQLTVDGLELTWAVNHLAPFLLTALLLDRIRASAPARVITTASGAHRGARVPFDDVNAAQGYRGFRRYGETKLANILFTAELARRLAGSGVTATCLHPGFVATGFNRNNGGLMSFAMTLARPFARSPQKGADTLVWLADSADIPSESGGYYANRKLARPSPAARDLTGARRLWELSEEQTGLAVAAAS